MGGPILAWAYNQRNTVIQIQDIIYNVDEIPIVLQCNKQRKQLCTIDADMVQVRQAHLTRNPKYRSATIVPIIVANGNIPIWLKPLLLLPGRPEGPTKKILDKRVITYMNENAYLTQAAWDYYIKYLKSLFKNNTAIIYVDNLSTHFAHIDTSRPITSYLTSSTTTSSASKSTNVSFHLRSLIPNSTHIMQPLDQHVGRFIQVNIHNKYRGLILSQEKEYEMDKEIKKIGIAELREKTAKWIDAIWDELKNNHKKLLIGSWDNSGLFLPFDGKNDFEFQNVMTNNTNEEEEKQQESHQQQAPYQKKQEKEEQE